MQVKGWIEFRWKLPYSSLPGKPLPEDFLVIVTYHEPTADPKYYEYFILSAQEATTLAIDYPDRYIAWMSFEEYKL